MFGRKGTGFVPLAVALPVGAGFSLAARVPVLPGANDVAFACGEDDSVAVVLVGEFPE